MDWHRTHAVVGFVKIYAAMLTFYVRCKQCHPWQKKSADLSENNNDYFVRLMCIQIGWPYRLPKAIRLKLAKYECT
jgi:hypothetical protein